MIQTVKNYIFGSDTNLKETLNIPILAGTVTSLSLRTYNNITSVINWGDGQSQSVDFSTAYNHTYSSSGNYTISVDIKGGLRNVKELRLIGTWSYNFNFGDFLSNLKRLKTISIDTYRSMSLASTDMQLSGDLSAIPDSVEVFDMISFSNITKLSMNCSSFSAASKLKRLTKTGSSAAFDKGFAFTGDLAKLPPEINYLYFNSGSKVTSSSLSYTAGRVWASVFDTFRVDVAILTSTIIDNLLIDFNNSITASAGDKLITFKGSRTAASDAAVLGLQAKGFTVTITA